GFTLAVDHAILHGPLFMADIDPAGEILAVEQRDPLFVGKRFAPFGSLAQEERRKGDCENQFTHWHRFYHKTMVRRFIARPFFRPEAEELRYLPECPRVLPNGMLGWVAIQHGMNGENSREGSFHLLDLATGCDRGFPLPGRPGFFAPTTR